MFVEGTVSEQEDSFYRDRNLKGSSLSSRKGVCAPFWDLGTKLLSTVALWLFRMGALQQDPQAPNTEENQGGWQEKVSVC